MLQSLSSCNVSAVSPATPVSHRYPQPKISLLFVALGCSHPSSNLHLGWTAPSDARGSRTHETASILLYKHRSHFLWLQGSSQLAASSVLVRDSQHLAKSSCFSHVRPKASIHCYRFLRSTLEVLCCRHAASHCVRICSKKHTCIRLPGLLLNQSVALL